MQEIKKMCNLEPGKETSTTSSQSEWYKIPNETQIIPYIWKPSMTILHKKTLPINQSTTLKVNLIGCNSRAALLKRYAHAMGK